MQRNLAKGSADGSLRRPPASRPGTASSGGHTSGKRELASDPGPQDAQHSYKRSRLAGSGSDERADIAGPLPHHDQQQPPNVALQSLDANADDAETYDAVMQMVQQVQGNRISRAGREAKDSLRSLDAAEGIGVIAWLIDALLSQRTDTKAKDLIKDWVTDLHTFIRRRTQ